MNVTKRPSVKWGLRVGGGLFLLALGGGILLMMLGVDGSWPMLIRNLVNSFILGVITVAVVEVVGLIRRMLKFIPPTDP
jgi:hypothetical protein